MARARRATAFPLPSAPFKSCILTNLDLLVWDRDSKLWHDQQWCYSGTWKALDRTSEVGSGLESSTHSTSMSLCCKMSRWMVLKLECATESTRRLVKMHTLGLTPRFSRAGVGVRKGAFLIRSQVMLMPLVHAPHFENNWIGDSSDHLQH